MRSTERNKNIEVSFINSERKQREYRARYEEILDVAAEVFSRKGYFATRMEDIAEQAQYSKAALYRYFPSKEEIYGRVLVRGVLTLQAKLEEAWKEQHGELSGLELVWRNLTSYYREYPQLLEAIALLQHNDIRQALSAELLQEIEQVGATNFRRMGQVILPDEPHEATRIRFAQVVWSTFTGTVQLAQSQAHIGHVRNEQEALFQAAFRLLSQGLEGYR